MSSNVVHSATPGGTEGSFVEWHPGTPAATGPDNRTAETHVRNVARSRVDGLEYTTIFLHLPDPQNFASVEFEGVDGLKPPKVDQVKEGSYRIRFYPDKPLEMGEELAWGFIRKYRYIENVPELQEDRHSVWTKHPGFEAHIEVNFDGPHPRTVWQFDESIMLRPGEPSENRLLTLNGSTATIHFEATETQARWAYGIGWRWS